MKLPALMHSLQPLGLHQGQGLSPSRMTAMIRRALGSQIILKTRRAATVDPDTIVIGGCYDSEADQQGWPAIELTLNYHPAQETILLDAEDWHRTCLAIAECIGHEQVHREQYRGRGWLDNPHSYHSTSKDPALRDEQEYLGDPDELEAYGYSIAAELAEMHGVFDVDHPALDQVFMYRVYLETFDTDKSVVLKLRQYISKYLRRLEVDYNEKTNPRSNPRTRRRA